MKRTPRKLVAGICCVITLSATAVSANIPRDFDGHTAYGPRQRMDDPTVCKTIYFDHENFSAVAGNEGEVRRVRASWYGNQFHTGQNDYVPSGGQMANGEYFHECDATVVAHKTLPKGTVIRVTYPPTGLTLMMVVQDRGPYHQNREIDLSRGAAQHLGIIADGVGEPIVEMEILGTP